MCKFIQKHRKLRFAVDWNCKITINFEKKAIRKTKFCKKQPQKSNFEMKQAQKQATCKSSKNAVPQKQV